jgi:hypothetical protein
MHYRALDRVNFHLYRQVLLRGLWRRRGLPASRPMPEAKEGLLEVCEGWRRLMGYGQPLFSSDDMPTERS